MSQSQYSLSWDSYQSNICSGFSSLQQSGEFVDMTLAADGHIVKVHQVIMALASPYLKELINSAPCQHPVIFLNNVNHKTLCYLLEYIYTGEVLVPSENFQTFISTAKSLHIRGLENVVGSGGGYCDNLLEPRITVSREQENAINITAVRHMSIPTDQGLEQVDLPPLARKVHIKREKSGTITAAQQHDSFDYADVLDDTRNDSDDDARPNFPNSSNTNDEKQAGTNLQFTVSNRGSLQVILNRYLYNLHSTSHRAGMRRWRCVDYRNNRCPAYVITKGNIVLNRSNLHTHPFHDKKILSKIERKAVYSALDDVAGVKDKDKNTNAKDDDAMEQDSLLEQFAEKTVNVQ